jgi:hypothetical protein
VPVSIGFCYVLVLQTSILMVFTAFRRWHQDLFRVCLGFASGRFRVGLGLVGGLFTVCVGFV